MRILLTGATGLIGRALQRALKHQHQLLLLSRNAKQAAKRWPDAGQWLNDLTAVDFNQLDAVINLAGEPIADKRWNHQQKQRILTSRLNITNQIANAIADCDTPPKVLLSGSAIGYYGRQKASTTVTEADHQCHDEFSHQLCYAWEQAALRAQSANTRVCVLRTGIVLSRRGGMLKKLYWPYQLGFGGPMGKGNQMMSWIHINDMVKAIVFLLEHPQAQGAFNMTAPNPVSNNRFSQCLAEQLKRPNLCRMPESILKLMFGELSEIMLTGQKVLPARLLAMDFHFQYRELNQALAQLYPKDKAAALA